MNQAPGWHGKLPSLGDFASRRLDPAFIEVWDAWLAEGLLALREGHAEWLDAYLGSPSWRFLLAPEALPGPAGTQGWAGVLMPSVDRVGRYFPLTIVLPLGSGPCDTERMRQLWFWLARLDELARDALHDDWTAGQLDDELARMALPDLAAAASAPDVTDDPAPATLIELPPGLDAASVIAVQAQQGWAARSRGRAWWQAAPDEGPKRLLLSRGLPPPAAFTRLFGPTA
jgi:type VI secretion system protein ImpM